MSANPYESPETAGNSLAWKTSLLKLTLRVLTVVGVLVLLAALFLPSPRRFGAREASRRMACSNNLRQIAVALQNYESKYRCLPPAYTVDAEGKPLHSWRTLILPFLDQKALYDQVDLSKPWDDPVNQEAAKGVPRVYRCPSGDLSKSHTTYLAVVAPGGCFKPTEARKLGDINDSRDLTLMVMEVSEKHAVHWMSPNDATEELILSRPADREFSHPYGAQGLFVSGNVSFLPRNTSPDVLRALISIAGHDDNIAQQVD